MHRHSLLSLTATGLVIAMSGPALAADCGAEHKPVAQTTLSAHGKADIVDTAVAAGQFNTLATALKAAGLIDALKGKGPFTVFAPTDEAFAKLPEGAVERLLKPENKETLRAVLTYHVVPGAFPASKVVDTKALGSLNGQRIDISTERGVKVENARVVKTDIECSNGVIHVIDRVIMPSTDSILQTAAKAGSFETLSAAIRAAGLVETLSGKGPFTVFAPTDAAFAKLPAGTLESLLQPENRHQLVDILKYHVVSGRVYADQALEAKTATTVEGSRIRFSAGHDGPMVNDASITQFDLDCSNGVIHVIDQVLLPG